jgi:hypothetical protein
MRASLRTLITMRPSSDHTLIATVNAHLRQLRSLALHNVDEATLRMASGSLRFLIVDGNLERAWRASGIGGPMTFRTWCIAAVEPNQPVAAFCGGGDVLPGIPFSACRGARLIEKTLDLRSLTNAARIQVGDVKISTAEVIAYVANALGGSHYDPSGRTARKPKSDLLRRLEAGEIEGPPLRVNGRSLLHHEILSIAQAITRSAQVARLSGWKPVA